MEVAGIRTRSVRAEDSDNEPEEAGADDDAADESDENAFDASKPNKDHTSIS